RLRLLRRVAPERRELHRALAGLDRLLVLPEAEAALAAIDELIDEGLAELLLRRESAPLHPRNRLELGHSEYAPDPVLGRRLLSGLRLASHREAELVERLLLLPEAPERAGPVVVHHRERIVAEPDGPLAVAVVANPCDLADSVGV